MAGLKLPHDIYVHIAGIDIVRVDADDFYVLEDNARTPSGVSYMLENREVMMRLFPDLFAAHRIAPVENYPEELLATLKSVAPHQRARRADRRAADTRPLQQRLLRALVPRRQARHRTGRGARPPGARQHRSDAHHRGAEARRRHLPPGRRRFPRPPDLPPGLDPRRSRPDERLPGRQRHPRQCRRHRRRATTRRSIPTCRRSSASISARSRS